MRERTLSQSVNEALAEEMERDARVFLIGEDIGLHGGAFGVTKGLFHRFGPGRVRSTPISEAAIAGAAVGAALVGARPVAELMYVDFITIAMDQIVNQGAKVKYMFGGKARVPLTVRTLTEIGFVREAEGFRRFMERSCAGSAAELHILFGVGGERRLREFEIRDMEGYRRAAPARVGNAAETQVQLDVYGELLDLAWNSHQRGHSPDDGYWGFLVELVNAAAKLWRNQDRGIWEMRS